MSDNPSAPCMVHPFDITVDDDKRLVSLGMTLRDYFAGQALAGFMANTRRPTTMAEDDATWCYSIADAMIAARTGDA